MARLLIDNYCYPATMKIYEGDSLKFSTNIDDFNKTTDEVMNSLDIGVFEQIYLAKAIYLFKPNKIEVKDNDEK